MLQTAKAPGRLAAFEKQPVKIAKIGIGIKALPELATFTAIFVAICTILKNNDFWKSADAILS